jgi:hypothetical protein
MSEVAAPVIEGGFWHGLMLRLRLARVPDAAPAPRALLLAAIAWVPLALLALYEGRELGGAAVPFLYDLAVHARFLIAIPVLVLGEPLLEGRLRPVVRQFEESGLVGDDARAGFQSAIDHVRKRIEGPIELAFLVLAYALAVHFADQGLVTETTTWRSEQTASGVVLNAAGQWYRLVSVPLFLFLVLRWLWWLGLWAGFLRRVARLPLRYVLAHPDGHGGLGFVASAQTALMALLFALSAVVSAGIGSRILFSGHALREFYPALGTFVVLSLVFTLAPLVVFAPGLAAAKRVALRAYSGLASHTGRRFESKWLGAGVEDPGSLLEVGDVSAVCDFGEVYDRVQRLQPVPLDRAGVVPLVIAAVAPLLPLALTVWPLDVIVKQLLQALF